MELTEAHAEPSQVVWSITGAKRLMIVAVNVEEIDSEAAAARVWEVGVNGSTC